MTKLESPQGKIFKTNRTQRCYSMCTLLIFGLENGSYQISRYLNSKRNSIQCATRQHSDAYSLKNILGSINFSYFTVMNCYNYYCRDFFEHYAPNLNFLPSSEKLDYLISCLSYLIFVVN